MSRHTPPVDSRARVCPFLLRLFVQRDQHHTAEQYASSLTVLPSLALHVWHDCTLHQLIALIHTAPSSPLPPPLPQRATFSFALVYPDRAGKLVVRQAASVKHDVGGGERDEAGQRTLRELKLEIGDFLDVAVSGGPAVNTTVEAPS